MELLLLLLPGSVTGERNVRKASSAFKYPLSTKLFIRNSFAFLFHDNSFSYSPQYELFLLKGRRALVGQTEPSVCLAAPMSKSPLSAF